MDKIALLQSIAGQGSLSERQTLHNPTQNETQPPTQVKPYGELPCMLHASDFRGEDRD